MPITCMYRDEGIPMNDISSSSSSSSSPSSPSSREVRPVQKQRHTKYWRERPEKTNRLTIQRSRNSPTGSPSPSTGAKKS
ncbi:uncharacterized protein K489DRAFT_375442 [Dissoconium aciculare CBS 342.82]|uniref:Uncharacterized protein n=1 Tax=Dissoconium aciculare CBS 342.82 TaxID=1314786 RepID=A0A6J3MHD0_9PEZI|nr:uncharacterized protein K489DRAFT_375442 [Dissoconium aciculare CBS 342.82]KAF1827356.1 hypothetical protein K489DRAFT_375442 [Dissoconium aciculare CBS 342.82]